VSGFLGVEIDKDASLAIITPLPWPTFVGSLHTRLMPSLTPLRLTGN
jgi:hypothetical protein